MDRSARTGIVWIVVAVCTTVAIADFGSASLRDSVRTGVARSPDDFVAGLFETRGETTCDAERCWTEAIILETFASRGRDAHAHPDRLRVSSSGPAGTKTKPSRVLGMLVPTEPGGEIYAGTYLSRLTDADSRETFRAAVESVLHGEIRDEATIGTIRDAARDLGITRRIVFAENVIAVNLWTVDVWFEQCRDVPPRDRPIRFHHDPGGWRAAQTDPDLLRQLERACAASTPDAGERSGEGG